jgi:FkbM family methyltransferase
MLVPPLIRKVHAYRRYLGLRDGIMFALMEVSPHERIKPVRLMNVELYLRTSSPDLRVAVSALNKEYASIKCADPDVVVDAGAYIRASSIFFARRYPEATIIAIEPDEANYALLLQNTSAYSNIVPLKAALWKEDCPRVLLDRNTGPWGNTIAGACDGALSLRNGVCCMTLTSIMNKFDLDHIDLLKLDIEGAEKDVFEACETWIDQVGIVTAELHDRICNGCSDAFYTAMADFSNFEINGKKVTAYRGGNIHRGH